MSATQITDSVPQSCGQVEISTDNVTWLDISGESQTVEQPEATRMVGEAFTLAGNGPIIQSGKIEAFDVVVRILYSEADAEAYEQVRAIFEQTGCNNRIYFRYSPRGGIADHERLTCYGPLSSFLYPNLDASAAGPIVGGFTVRTGGFATTIIAS